MRKKVALALASVALSLLLAEVALRVAGVARAGRGSEWFAGGNHPRFLFQADARAGYTLRPGFTGIEMNAAGDFRERIAVDESGLRRQPHVAEAGPAKPAVLALGDSMTFGEGIPAGDTYTAVAERTSGVRFDNAGVPGYASSQMVRHLEQLVPLLRPRLVLFAFSPLWDRQRCATPFVYKEGFIVAPSYVDRLYLLDGNLYLAETKWPVAGPATAYAKGYSRVMRVLLPPLGGALRAIAHPPHPEPTPRAADYDPTLANVEQAATLSRSMGASFAVLLLDDWDAEYRRDRLEVEKRLRSRGIDFLAVDEALPKVEWERLRFPHDGHWNRDGHRAVGLLVSRLADDLSRRR